VRFGVMNSALFAAVTTDASCGAVNAMHDSFTPLGGMVPLLNIESDFSLVFGGLFMNGVALWGLLVALSQLPTRRTRRSWLAADPSTLGALARWP